MTLYKPLSEQAASRWISTYGVGGVYGAAWAKGDNTTFDLPVESPPGTWTAGDYSAALAGVGLGWARVGAEYHLFEDGHIFYHLNEKIFIAEIQGGANTEDRAGVRYTVGPIRLAEETLWDATTSRRYFADCAERMEPYFAAARPADVWVEEAIDRARAYATAPSRAGLIELEEARLALLTSRAELEETDDYDALTAARAAIIAVSNKADKAAAQVYLGGWFIDPTFESVPDRVTDLAWCKARLLGYLDGTYT